MGLAEQLQTMEQSTGSDPALDGNRQSLPAIPPPTPTHPGQLLVDADDDYPFTDMLDRYTQNVKNAGRFVGDIAVESAKATPKVVSELPQTAGRIAGKSATGIGFAPIATISRLNRSISDVLDSAPEKLSALVGNATFSGWIDSVTPEGSFGEAAGFSKTKFGGPERIQEHFKAANEIIDSVFAIEDENVFQEVVEDLGVAIIQYAAIVETLGAAGVPLGGAAALNTKVMSVLARAGVNPTAATFAGGAASTALGFSEFMGISSIPEAAIKGDPALPFQNALRPTASVASLAGKVATGRPEEITTEEVLNTLLIGAGGALNVGAGLLKRPMTAKMVRRNADDMVKDLTGVPEAELLRASRLVNASNKMSNAVKSELNHVIGRANRASQRKGARVKQGTGAEAKSITPEPKLLTAHQKLIDSKIPLAESSRPNALTEFESVNVKTGEVTPPANAFAAEAAAVKAVSPKDPAKPQDLKTVDQTVGKDKPVKDQLAGGLEAVPASLKPTAKALGRKARTITEVDELMSELREMRQLGQKAEKVGEARGKKLAKEATKDTTERLRALNGDLVRVVKESGLPAESKKRILTEVSNFVDSLPKFEKRVARVQREIEKVADQAARGRVKDAIKALNKRKIRQETKDRLGEIIDRFEVPDLSLAVLGKIKKLVRRLAEKPRVDPLSTKPKEKLPTSLSKLLGRDATRAENDALGDLASRVLHGDEMITKEVIDGQAYEWEQLRNRSRDEFKGLKSLKERKRVELQESDVIQSVGPRVKEPDLDFMDALALPFLKEPNQIHPDILETLGFSRDSVTYKLLYDNLRLSQNKTWETKHQLTDQLNNFIEQQLGLDLAGPELASMSREFAGAMRTWRAMLTGGKEQGQVTLAKPMQTQVTNKKTGKTEIVTMVGAERISLLLQSMDPSTAKLYFTGENKIALGVMDPIEDAFKMTELDIDVLRLTATEAERGIATQMFRMVNGPIREILDEAGIARDGVPFTLERAMYNRRVMKTDDKPRELADAVNVRELTGREIGLGKERTNAPGTLIIEDAFVQFANIVHQVSALRDQVPAIESAMRLLDDSTIRNQIKQSRGKKLSRRLSLTLDAMAQDIVGGANSTEGYLSTLMSRSVGRARTAQLALSDKVPLYQWVSVFQASDVIPGKYLMRSFRQLAAFDPVMGAEMRANSARIRERMDHGIGGLVSEGIPGQARLQGFIPPGEWLMSPTKGVDNMTIQVIWGAAKLWADDILGAQALEKALAKGQGTKLLTGPPEPKQIGEAPQATAPAQAPAATETALGPAPIEAKVVKDLHRERTPEHMALTAQIAEDVINRTQPTRDPLHATGIGLEARRNAFVSAISMFRSQIGKSLSMYMRIFSEGMRGTMADKRAAFFKIFKIATATAVSIAVMKEGVQEAEKKVGKGVLKGVDLVTGTRMAASIKDESLADSLTDIGLGTFQAFSVNALAGPLITAPIVQAVFPDEHVFDPDLSPVFSGLDNLYRDGLVPAGEVMGKAWRREAMELVDILDAAAGVATPTIMLKGSPWLNPYRIARRMTLNQLNKELNDGEDSGAFDASSLVP